MSDEIQEYWMKNWPKETPRHIDYPQISLTQYLRRTVDEYPNSQAIFFEGYRITYKDLMVAVDQFTTALAKIGIKKGDVVLIDTPNIPQFVIAFYAIVQLGAIANPIIPLNRFVEIVHQVNDSKGKLLIILDHLYEEHLHGKDLSKMPTLKDIIMTGLGEYLPKVKAVLGKALKKVPFMKVWPEKVNDVKFHKFQEILQSGIPIAIPEVKIDTKKDAAVLIYTGGTTGTPKACMNTHYNLIVNAYQGLTWAETQMPEIKDAKGKGGMVIIVPLAHSFGLSIGMNIAVARGYKMILLPKPPEKISKVLKIIKKEEATFMPGVPTLYIKINDDPDSIKFKNQLTSFKAGLSGASALPLEVKKKFEDITGCTIIEGYGMSEASPILTITPFDFKLYKENTVGFPVSDTILKITDIEDGTKILPQCTKGNCDDCGSDESQFIGEICANGPQIMLGYLGRKEDTDYALRKDSKGRIWYYSTDIGCIDKDGYLRIKDRKRDMIKYKGHAVFPREVEDLMYMHEAVLEVGVIGVPDPDSIQTIKAFVALKSEYKGKVTKDDLMKWAQENISPYKYPRIIEIVPELPKSVVGKILRRELREE